MPQPETHPSLVLRLKDRANQRAWQEFVSAYEPFLNQLVRRARTPERDVADISQQLLCVVAKSIDNWKSDGREASFRRWLSRIARNVSIKYLTREKRQVRGQGGTDFLELIAATPDFSVSEEDARRYESELMLWAAEQVRDQFRESSWKAFWATEIEGRPVKEVAAELGVSTGSIYMSRGRIIAKLRSKIAALQAEQ